MLVETYVFAGFRLAKVSEGRDDYKGVDQMGFALDRGDENSLLPRIVRPSLS